MPNDAGIWQATLTRDAIDQAWKKGISETLRTARYEILRLLKYAKQGLVSSPLVVVSGGTARNPAVKSYLTTLCDTAEVSVLFTNDFDVPILHALVAL